IHAALGVVTTPFAFVFACDMPALCGPLIDMMAARAGPGRLLVPRMRGRAEPLHALYPVSCLPGIERARRDAARMCLDFFARVPVDYLEEDEMSAVPGASRSFDNVNTPQDLEALR